MVPRMCRIQFFNFYDVLLTCYTYILRWRPSKSETKCMLGHGLGVKFASDTDILQQRLYFSLLLLQPMHFRVADLRKLEDSEHDIRMTDGQARVLN